jgi:hypothetical protein
MWESLREVWAKTFLTTIFLLIIFGFFYGVKIMLKDEKNRRFNKKRINKGLPPDYITNKDRSLWIDNEHYDNYSKEHKCFVLVDERGFFWGYSDNLKIKALNNGK